MQDYMDEIYERNFEIYYEFMTMRKETDPEFTKEDLKQLLAGFYAAQDSNWGVSEAKATAHQAMIAACEVVLSNWDDAP
jgi:hypothetical protein